MRVLFIGDVVAKPGRQALHRVVPQWRAEHQPDLVVANGENSAGGSGISPSTARDLFAAGVDVLTTGNHVFHHKEMVSYLATAERVARPLNYPPGTPGTGAVRLRAGADDVEVLVANALGRLFMAPLDCPFRALDKLLLGASEDGPRVILVDFHAEATSEKRAMGHYLDGRASLVVGTHTHVPTADTQILPGGTAYVTDVGMAGPLHSVIGMETGPILERFLTGLPRRYGPALGPVTVNAVLADIDAATGRALAIRRLDTVVDLAPGGTPEDEP
ncbi:MAG: TIGR00282 family metallophosphoesterase [Chloroflexota bacterium]